MSSTCHDCGADDGTVGVIRRNNRKTLCPTCLEREDVNVLPEPPPKSINDLPMDLVCGNCGRRRADHLPRADWQCPAHGLYFNEPTPLIRRIAEAVGYKGLSDQLWLSDLEGLVEHVKVVWSR